MYGLSVVKLVVPVDGAQRGRERGEQGHGDRIVRAMVCLLMTTACAQSPVVARVTAKSPPAAATVQRPSPSPAAEIRTSGSPSAPPAPEAARDDASPRSAATSEAALEAELSECRIRPALTGPEPTARFIHVGEDKPHTYWVEVGPQGANIVATSADVVLAWNGGVWREHFNLRTEKGEGCAEFGLEGMGDNEGGELVLQRLDAAAPDKLLDSTPPSGMAEGSARSAIVGIVGEMLFLKRQEHTYHCGAHGGTVLDLLMVRLDGSNPARPQPTPALRSQAKQRAADYYGQQEMEPNTTAQPNYVGVTPLFSEGKPQLRYAFVTATSYAASTWGSYEHAVFVKAPMPRPLAREAAVPPWLRELDCKEPIVGLSPAPLYAAAAEGVKRAFVRSRPTP